MDISNRISQQSQREEEYQPVPIPATILRGASKKRESGFRRESKGKPKQYQEEFIMAHELLPVRCFSCGKVLKGQQEIEKFIQKDPLFIESEQKATQAIYKLAGIERICCRRMILTSPLINRLIRERMSQIEGVKKLKAGGRDLLLETLEPHRDVILPSETVIPSLGTDEGNRHREEFAEDFNSTEELAAQLLLLRL